MEQTPTNTAEEAKQDPMKLLTTYALLGSEAIRVEEEQGQRELCNSSVLPTEENPSYYPGSRAILEKAGVIFGDAIKGDPLFTYVQLPPGWRIVPTEHTLWSNLMDDKGRCRANVFYKAAFYDRRAHFQATPRYTGDIVTTEEGMSGKVYDGDKVIWETPAVARPKNPKDEYDAECDLISQLEVWLDENFPDWCNPAAYWD